jgi:hypothetical protein
MITFAALKDINTGERTGWGLRGDKSTPSEQPPEEGTTITVTKRSGETNDVVMGEVIAQGDDWWLATLGVKKEVARPPGLSETRARYEPEHNTVVEGVTPPPSPIMAPITPPYDANSTNYTERRLAAEEAADRAEDEARLAERAAKPDESGEFNWND